MSTSTARAEEATRRPRRGERTLIAHESTVERIEGIGRFQRTGEVDRYIVSTIYPYAVTSHVLYTHMRVEDPEGP